MQSVCGNSDYRIFYAISQYTLRNIFTIFKGGENLLYDNVKAICSEKKVTISKMEADLGFPRSSICKWNTNEPGVSKVKKVADYLKVNIERLIS